MTEERWAYIKALSLPAPRWVHISVSYRDEEVTDEAGVVHKRRVKINHGSYKKGTK